MLRRVIALICFAGASSISAQGPRPEAATIAASVDSLARRAVASGAVPGLGVAVVMDGRTILARSYGMADATSGVPADDNTLWYVASTSKSFTGFAMTLLAEERGMAFDTPIVTLLPTARWHASARPAELTLAHFLSHTSGLGGGAVVAQAVIVGETPEREWPALLEWSEPMPTRDLVYSNLGYYVAAMVIDQLHPAGWRDFSERRIFGPLGMRNTFARVSGIDRPRIALSHQVLANGTQVSEPFPKNDLTMSSAGGHLATVADLARWVTVQMDSGVIDGRRVFPAAVVARSHTLIAPHTSAQARRFAFFDRIGWGAGWDIGSYEGERMVSRFGSFQNTRSHLSFLPGRRIGVVAESNGPLGNQVTDIIAALVYDLEAGRPEARSRASTRLDERLAMLPAAVRSVAASDSVRASRQQVPLAHGWEAILGSYTHPAGGTITFHRDASGVRYRWGTASSAVEIYNGAQNAVRIEIAGSGTVVQFRAGVDGVAERATVQGVEFVRRPGDS